MYVFIFILNPGYLPILIAYSCYSCRPWYLVGVDQNDDNLDDCIGLHGRKFNTSAKVRKVTFAIYCYTALVNVYAVLN